MGAALGVRVFERLWTAFGTVGPSVNTVVETPVVCPGGTVRGRVHIQGAEEEVFLIRVVLGLVAQAVVVDPRENRRELCGAQLRQVVAGQQVVVPAHEPVEIPFTLPVPWDTPVTVVGDAELPLTVGVRTELVALHARDASDLDPVVVEPLPSQTRVLDAFGQLGTVFDAVNLAPWAMPGIDYGDGAFPVVLQFLPPSGQLLEVRLMSIADERDLRVLLLAVRRGRFGFNRKVTCQFHMTHEQAGLADWTSLIGGWLAGVAR